MAKYKNRITILDGIRFDSKKEANRWAELKMLERDGVIKNLQRQKKYVLIPTQYYQPSGKGKKKVLEKECSYIADFVYVDRNTGKTVVEDTKGVRTAAYIIKRKLMYWVHGIKIREI